MNEIMVLHFHKKLDLDTIKSFLLIQIGIVKKSPTVDLTLAAFQKVADSSNSNQAPNPYV